MEVDDTSDPSNDRESNEEEEEEEEEEEQQYPYRYQLQPQEGEEVDPLQWAHMQWDEEDGFDPDGLYPELRWAPNFDVERTPQDAFVCSELACHTMNVTSYLDQMAFCMIIEAVDDEGTLLARAARSVQQEVEAGQSDATASTTTSAAAAAAAAAAAEAGDAAESEQPGVDPSLMSMMLGVMRDQNEIDKQQERTSGHRVTLRTQRRRYAPHGDESVEWFEPDVGDVVVMNTLGLQSDFLRKFGYGDVRLRNAVLVPAKGYYRSKGTVNPLRPMPKPRKDFDGVSMFDVTNFEEVRVFVVFSASDVAFINKRKKRAVQPPPSWRILYNFDRLDSTRAFSIAQNNFHDRWLEWFESTHPHMMPNLRRWADQLYSRRKREKAIKNGTLSDTGSDDSDDPDDGGRRRRRKKTRPPMQYKFGPRGAEQETVTVSLPSLERELRRVAKDTESDAEESADDEDDAVLRFIEALEENEQERALLEREKPLRWREGVDKLLQDYHRLIVLNQELAQQARDAGVRGMTDVLAWKFHQLGDERASEARQPQRARDVQRESDAWASFNAYLDQFGRGARAIDPDDVSAVIGVENAEEEEEEEAPLPSPPRQRRQAAVAAEKKQRRQLRSEQKRKEKQKQKQRAKAEAEEAADDAEEEQEDPMEKRRNRHARKRTRTLSPAPEEEQDDDGDQEEEEEQEEEEDAEPRQGRRRQPTKRRRTDRMGGESTTSTTTTTTSSSSAIAFPIPYPDVPLQPPQPTNEYLFVLTSYSRLPYFTQLVCSRQNGEVINVRLPADSPVLPPRLPITAEGLVCVNEIDALYTCDRIHVFAPLSSALSFLPLSYASAPAPAPPPPPPPPPFGSLSSSGFLSFPFPASHE